LGWETEIEEYADRVARVGVPTLLVNRSDPEFVGGATFFAADGSVLAAAPPSADIVPLTVET
jgi:hypothetical protein